jgi:hypothetical protein
LGVENDLDRVGIAVLGQVEAERLQATLVVAGRCGHIDHLNRPAEALGQLVAAGAGRSGDVALGLGVEDAEVPVAAALEPGAQQTFRAGGDAHHVGVRAITYEFRVTASSLRGGSADGGTRGRRCGGAITSMPESSAANTMAARRPPRKAALTGSFPS